MTKRTAQCPICRKTRTVNGMAGHIRSHTHIPVIAGGCFQCDAMFEADVPKTVPPKEREAYVTELLLESGWEKRDALWFCPNC